MAEYIKREAAFEAITDLAGKAPTRSAYEAVWKSARALKKVHAADVVPVVHGKWISFLDGDHIVLQWFYRCSHCGRVESRRHPYCHCGAKMDGGNGNEV